MTTSVAQVVGANVRTLRRDAGITLDQFATGLRSHGLAWSSGRVGTLESGKLPPMTVETLYTLAAVLGQLIGRDVPLTALLATSQPVSITDRLEVGGAALSLAVSGQPVKRTASFSGEGTLSATVGVVAEADRRMCQRLGVDVETGMAAMVRLWGHPFSSERDLRAEPGANAQRLGIIARRLKTELVTELETTESRKETH